MDVGLNREPSHYLEIMLSVLFCDIITVFYDFDGTGLSVFTKSLLLVVSCKTTFSNKPLCLLTDLYVVWRVTTFCEMEKASQ